jgi:hypothetical protein
MLGRERRGLGIKSFFGVGSFANVSQVKEFLRKINKLRSQLAFILQLNLPWVFYSAD